MARASTETLLSLDRWAAILGINPLHFNGVESAASPSTTCSNPVMQYDWQAADRVGREDIAQAIADAEESMIRYLGFLPKPGWIADEPHWLNNGSFWGSPIAKVDNGYVISGGQEAWALIENVTVSYADLDGDGYKETATCTCTTTDTSDVDEIAVCSPGLGGGVTEEIRPVSVALSGTTFTMTFRREQAVIPALQEGFDSGARSVNGDDDANFLATVDVYRHYNDPSMQARFFWTPEASRGPFSSLSCTCGSSSCASCSYLSQYGCMSIRDQRTGMVAMHPGDWDAESASFIYNGWSSCAYNPARAAVWYRSGWRNGKLARPMNMMDQRYERAITYLSLSLLARPICQCTLAERVMSYWAEDLAVAASAGDESHSHQQTPYIRDCPLGTTRAALRMWDIIQRDRLGEAVLAV